jgi:hypothetical protein
MGKVELATKKITSIGGTKLLGNGQTLHPRQTNSINEVERQSWEWESRHVRHLPATSDGQTIWRQPTQSPFTNDYVVRG